MSDYSVENEEGYARVYDDDKKIKVRRGDIQAVLDVATMSMDFASGFLDDEQVEALRKLAIVVGVDPIVVTPSNFVCKYTGRHEWQPAPQRFTQPPMEPDGDTPELLAELVLAKAEGDSERLEAAKRTLRAHREAQRLAAATWYQPDPIPLPPEEWCWRCGSYRPVQDQSSSP